MKQIIRTAITTTLFTTLLASTPASACQLICQKTITLFDGNLGGPTGADAKCAAELGTGWKFPRTHGLALNMSSPGTNTSTSNSLEKFVQGGYSVSNQIAWLGPLRWSAATVYNCANWASNSSSDRGGTVYNGGPGSISPSYGTCDTQLPLICCNM